MDGKGNKDLSTFVAMILTDTHTHLYSEQFNDDIVHVIKNSLEKGIERFFLPNIDSSSIEGMLSLEKEYPKHCFPMMGLHPCSVGENYLEELKIVKSWLDKKSFCAVGEIGIDLYWDKTFFKEQQDAFSTQIKWAKEKNLPFVIHCRDNQIIRTIIVEIAYVLQTANFNVSVQIGGFCQVYSPA